MQIIEHEPLLPDPVKRGTLGYLPKPGALPQGVKQYGPDKRSVLFQGIDLPTVQGRDEPFNRTQDKLQASQARKPLPVHAGSESQPFPGGVRHRELLSSALAFAVELRSACLRAARKQATSLGGRRASLRSFDDHDHQGSVGRYSMPSAINGEKRMALPWAMRELNSL